jgi:hypothetical protein
MPNNQISNREDNDNTSYATLNLLRRINHLTLLYLELVLGYWLFTRHYLSFLKPRKLGCLTWPSAVIS